MSNSSDMNGSSKSALEWLAFQYVAGELPAVEAEDFEAQLAVDQAAREAVAEAVAIAECVALNPPAAVPLSSDSLPLVVRMPRDERPVPAARSDRRVRLWPAAWIGVSIASCLAIVLAVVVPTRTGPIRTQPETDGPTVATTSRLGTQAAEIALIWAADREAEGDTDAETDDVEAGEQNEVGNASDDVPQWLLAAVSARDLVREGMDPEQDMLEE